MEGITKAGSYHGNSPVVTCLVRKADMLIQPSVEPILEKVLALRNPDDLKAFAVELLVDLDLNALQILTQKTHEYPVLIHVGESLPSLPRNCCEVVEVKSVWNFPLKDGDHIVGWLRVRLKSESQTDLVLTIKLLCSALQVVVARFLEKEHLRLFQEQAQLYSEQLQQIDRLKEEFLSNLSHELRTPLTGILGYVQILLEQKGFSSQQLDWLKTIHFSGQRLLGLINRLLQLAEIRAEQLHVNLILAKPSYLIEPVVEDVRGVAEAKGLQIWMEFSDTPAVMLDVSLFQESILHILENAIKFTKEGEIKIKTWMEDKNCCIEISDTGCGIDTKDLLFVFNAFWQGDGSMTREVGGNGIGLTLAKQFIHFMGGDVDIKSTLGKGTTLRIALPREFSPTPRKLKVIIPKQIRLPLSA